MHPGIAYELLMYHILLLDDLHNIDRVNGGDIDYSQLHIHDDVKLVVLDESVTSASQLFSNDYLEDRWDRLFDWKHDKTLEYLEMYSRLLIDDFKHTDNTMVPSQKWKVDPRLGLIVPLDYDGCTSG